MKDRHFQVWCRVLAGGWILAVLIATAQMTADNTNTFEIFRTAAKNLLAGRGLYGANATHFDFYDYSPTFALLFIPLAVLPLGLGVLLWNALNAGSLYWSLGRLLTPQQAFAARAIVFIDTVGSIQSRQSNALTAALIIVAFVELERRREARAATAVVLGTAVKIFPAAAAAFALFRPRRLPRFAAYALAIGIAFVLAPLVVLSPGELLGQYRAWFAMHTATGSLEYSVMDQFRVWFGVKWPYWPSQLLGTVVLLAPFWRSVARDESQSRYRLLCLASVLMFCLLFNHKAESPSFVIAVAGVAIWFVVSARDRVAWTLLWIVVVGTVLATSEAVPHHIQQRIVEPYRLKTLPILVLWLVTQWELWRRTASAEHPAPESDRGVPAT
jgi:hypothetical protein